ncbi:MAG: GGDEF domain-containing protein [Lachnospiraceae bacterium]|nr:GGDEF domain-containing protein [Lachnospiraceae bacterium]
MKYSLIDIMKYAFAGLMFFTVIFIMVFAVLITYNTNPKEDFEYYEMGWVTDDGKEADLAYIEKYGTVHRTLEEAYDHQMLYMNLKGINVEVFVGGELRTATELEYAPVLGKTPGAYNVCVELFRDDVGKEIRMVFQSPYGDGDGKVNFVLLGNSKDILLSDIRSKMNVFIFCFLYIYIGVIFLTIYFTLRKMNKNTKPILYLGLFSINIGMFMLCDGGMLQIIYGHASFYHTLAEVFMMLIAIPLMFYLETMYESVGKVGLLVISILAFLNYPICMILDMTGLADFHQTVFITHVVYIIAMILIIYSVVVSLKKHQWTHILGMLCITGGAMVDIILVNVSHFSENSLFTRIGALLFLCMEGVQFILSLLQWQQDINRQDFIHLLAYKDGLTGLLNRTSYEEDLEKYRKENKKPAAVTFIDINNLKYINDTYGHATGDELIMAVASTISRVFEMNGKCYRIGGDEFVFITNGLPEGKNIHSLEHHFQEELAQCKLRVDMTFVITAACGSVADKNSYEQVDDLLKEADRVMYANKKAMKSLDGGIYSKVN